MRHLQVLIAVAVTLLGAGCQFNPSIPNSRILCRNDGECPRGYTCEDVKQAAFANTKICCSEPRCAEALPPVDVARINAKVGEIQGRDGGADGSSDGPAPGGVCGNNKLDQGESCDPLASCPSMCPNMACQKRKLADGGTCQARCVDDGMQTECVGGDGCCPATCNATTDSDCRASCGNGALETGETCDPGETCPTACPAIGCTLQKLEGSARTCDVKCVESGKQTACASGDSCCPMGCTTANDTDCACVCGNGSVEATCGETCDPVGSCPTTCAPMGCQLRRLVNAGTCQAQCVNDGMQTMCASGDGCCPGGCNASNDNDCSARCGNGATEAGETCDPPSMCPRTCPWNGCGRRKLEGSADDCNARCVDDGTQTQCASGDGCCPPACTSINDSDCQPECGNGVREGSETCDGNDCPTSCPNQGCQRRKLQGNAAQCSATCVDDGTITACTGGDSCCANGCTSVNDGDCSARCGNGVREGNEKCDGTDCPTSCPAMGCMRRRLVGSAGQCTAECVPDGTVTTCTNADNCCPASCNRNNDNNCPALCGNGAVEPGETCDPIASCQSQSDMCVSDRNTIRTRSGAVASCTFRCTTTARPCSGTTDGQCPAACTPCGAACGANQDIDCKLPNGTACTHPNQCSSNTCTMFFRDTDTDGFGSTTTQVCGATPPAGHAAVGGDCCDTDNRAFPMAQMPPGQGQYFAQPNSCGSFDYNCNGAAEKANNGQYECNVERCFPGWTAAVPACGVTGTFRTCAASCSTGGSSMLVQRCR